MKKIMLFSIIYCSILCNESQRYISAVVEARHMPRPWPITISMNEEAQEETTNLCCLPTLKEKFATCQQHPATQCAREAAPLCGIICCGSVLVSACIVGMPMAALEYFKCIGAFGL